MPWQGLEGETTLKADDAVLLNGLPKVGAVVGKVLG
jgi:hypothetical protein